LPVGQKRFSHLVDLVGASNAIVASLGTEIIAQLLLGGMFGAGDGEGWGAAATGLLRVVCRVAGRSVAGHVLLLHESTPAGLCRACLVLHSSHASSAAL
jgi:hypothetical protein